MKSTGIIERRNRIALVLILIFFNTYFFQHYDNIPNPNEQSRIYLITAIVDHHRLSIDEEIKRFGDTIDISRYNGKAYCDKAPGLSFLGVPFYALLKSFSKILGLDLNYALILKYLRVVLLGIPSALFSLLLLSLLTRYLGDFQLSLIMTSFYAIGTIAFTYSNLLFGHQLGAMAAFIVFYLIKTASSPGPARLFLTGFIAGYAVVIEYPLIIISAILSIYQFIKLGKRVYFLYYVAGGMIAAIILMCYNYMAFGSPLSTGYAHIANPAFAGFHKVGCMGVTTPKITALVGSLFSSMRGIFFFMPLLIFSLYGIYLMIRDNDMRSDGILLLILFLAMLYFISSFSYWQAGGTVSQRHLTSIIPFLIIPLSISAKRILESKNQVSILVISSLMLFSMLLIPYATIPFPFFSVVYPNPLFELPLNLWRWGAIPLNISNLIGLGGLASAVPFILLWFLFVSYSLYLFMSYSRSPLFNSILALCITFVLISSASMIARDKNYEAKMKDVIGIVENFRPAKNSCEYVIENSSRRFDKITCYAFLKRGVDGIKAMREVRDGVQILQGRERGQ